MTNDIVLKFPRFIKCDEGKRSFFDNRVRVDSFTYEYTGSDGENYRKSFEVRAGAENPVVPQEGSHKDINALKKQW